MIKYHLLPPSGKYLGGNGGFLRFRIQWESRESRKNPGNPMEIQGVQWES